MSERETVVRQPFAAYRCRGREAANRVTYYCGRDSVVQLVSILGRACGVRHLMSLAWDVEMGSDSVAVAPQGAGPHHGVVLVVEHFRRLPVVVSRQAQCGGANREQRLRGLRITLRGA